MKLALLGQGISYSRSPEIHQKWMTYYGLEGTYDIHDCQESDLGAAMHLFDGMNVTIPFKKKVLSLVDEVSPWAERAGAINTLYQHAGRWIGENTDVLALLEMIPDTIQKIVVLGNGGAAQAVRAVGQERGQEVICVTRDLWSDRHVLLKDADMLINATPIGLNGDGCPIDALPDRPLIVMDMVYAPQETNLLKLAISMRHQTLDGLDMLCRQARHSFNCWWGIIPE